MLGAIGSILGGIGSVGGALLGASESRKNRQSQEEFAKNSVSWRVADAQKAGIHPVYALGMNGMNFSPVYNSSSDRTGLQGVGNAIQNMGAQSKAMREMEDLGVDKARKENKLLDLDIKQKELALAKMGQTPAFNGLNPYSISSAPSIEVMDGLSVSAKQAAIASHNLSYGLDKPIVGRSFSPLPNGGIELNPSKDMIDWVSESFPHKLSYYWDLYMNADEYAKKLSKALKADYIPVWSNPFFPTFKQRRDAKWYELPIDELIKGWFRK